MDLVVFSFSVLLPLFQVLSYCGHCLSVPLKGVRPAPELTCMTIPMLHVVSFPDPPSTLGSGNETISMHLNFTSCRMTLELITVVEDTDALYVCMYVYR